MVDDKAKMAGLAFKLWTDPFVGKIVFCRVYTGIARNPEQRYAKHLAGKGARFTRSNPPRALLGWVWVADRGSALRLEIAWKKLPRHERIAALRTATRL